MTAAHKRPEPLLTRAHVTAVISGLVSLLVTFNIIPATVGHSLSTLTQTVTATAFLLVTTIAPYVHAYASRKVVTPTADPRDDNGARLVSVGSGSAAVEAAVLDAVAIASVQPVEAAPTVDEPPAPVTPLVQGTLSATTRDPYASPVAH